MNLKTNEGVINDLQNGWSFEAVYHDDKQEVLNKLVSKKRYAEREIKSWWELYGD